MRFLKIIAMVLAICMINGCVLTKLVTVPMRLGGSVVSIVPVAGNHVNDVIQKAANTVDKAPI